MDGSNTDPTTVLMLIAVGWFLGWVITLGLYKKHTSEDAGAGMGIMTFFMWPIGLLSILLGKGVGNAVGRNEAGKQQKGKEGAQRESLDAINQMLETEGLQKSLVLVSNGSSEIRSMILRGRTRLKDKFYPVIEALAVDHNKRKLVMSYYDVGPGVDGKLKTAALDVGDVVKVGVEKRQIYPQGAYVDMCWIEDKSLEPRKVLLFHSPVDADKSKSVILNALSADGLFKPEAAEAFKPVELVL